MLEILEIRAMFMPLPKYLPWICNAQVTLKNRNRLQRQSAVGAPAGAATPLNCRHAAQLMGNQ
jgi:hypothetical protein